MYLAIPPQPDCASAWLAAVRAVDGQHDHEANNVIIDVQRPTSRASLKDPVVASVDRFLVGQGKKAVETVSNTIFPAALYRRYGYPAVFDRFRDNVLPKVRNKGPRWSGYYFERMMQLPGRPGETINQLEDIIRRVKSPSVTSLNKFELSVFDPARDVTDSNYGGQCLSYGSFKLGPGKDGLAISLTVLYRNHYYIEKLLGNLIGLGRLLDFVAREGGVEVGQLTVVSTHATIDQAGAKRVAILDLIKRCGDLAGQPTVAA